MAKQPDLKTIDDGWYETSDLNYNFKSIAAAFENALWRTESDGESYPRNPNFMDTDYDVADANVTNVNQLIVSSMEVANNAFPGFGSQYVHKLGQLSCSAGALLTHNASGDPTCLAPSTDGLVLRSSSGYPQWETDTDTDTVGVTVQEDGVTVAENVTTIDFKWTDTTYPTLVTTPAGNQVDLALDDVKTASQTALWEDTRADFASGGNDNINPDGPSAILFADAGEVNRLDITTVSGVSVPSSDNEYYFVAEVSGYYTYSGSNLDPGTWSLGIRFYDATGTSTSLTGVQITEPSGETALQTGTTAGGNLQTVFCGVPAGTKYIDTAYAISMGFPLFVTNAISDNRYRALIPGAFRDSFVSPNNKGYAGGNYPSVTPPP